MDLTGRTGLVTGGSKGIGYAIAEALARGGANVVVCARNADELAEAVEALDPLSSGRVLGVRCDMRVEGDVRRLVDYTVDELGRLDVLVNNAGVGRFAPVHELSTDDWHTVIETNLNGVFYASHAAIPHMKRAGSGWIINIGSLAGKNPFEGGAAYNASKFGLLGFSEAMMLDVRPMGIRVSCIMPGSVSTHFSSPVRGEAEQRHRNTPGDADAWKIQPEDIADVVMNLLATPERTLPSRIEVRPSRPPRK
jgi:3-oxoacyl-[acyl-carrier protein] reductase